MDVSAFPSANSGSSTSATYNDGIYILPRSKAEKGQNSGIEVRKDLMEKYGYTEEPKTMDELKDWLIGLSKAATEGEGKKVYALDFFDNAGNGFMDDRIKGFATAFTGQTDWEINEDGEFEYMQFDEKYIDFLNWMKDLYVACSQKFSSQFFITALVSAIPFPSSNR